MAAKRRQQRRGVVETRCFRKVKRRMVNPFEPITSRAKWNRHQSASELMRYAATRLARQHLALVLATIASRACRHWSAARPEDWSFAWTIALLRAWAFGEVSIEELRGSLVVNEGGFQRPAFVDDEGRDYGSCDDTSLSLDAVAAAASAVVRAVKTVAIVPPEEVEWTAYNVISAVEFADVRAAWLASNARSRQQGVREAADEEFERTERVIRKARRRVNSELLPVVRALVPYVSRSTSEWIVSGPLVVTGELLLRCDGWEVVDAVRLDELLMVDAKRAVAFDSAMERFGVAMFGVGGEVPTEPLRP